VHANNRPDAWGAFVFDIWTGNLDVRQFLRLKDSVDKSWLFMIDQGYCFGAERWSFHDKVLPCANRCLPGLYSDISGLESFEPWLVRLEAPEMSETIKTALLRVPSEWYGDSFNELSGMLAVLDERRFKVRGLLKCYRDKQFDLFPNWRDHVASPLSN